MKRWRGFVESEKFNMQISYNGSIADFKSEDVDSIPTVCAMLI